jgi:hypothetical protein
MAQPQMPVVGAQEPMPPAPRAAQPSGEITLPGLEVDSYPPPRPAPAEESSVPGVVSVSKRQRRLIAGFAAATGLTVTLAVALWLLPSGATSQAKATTPAAAVIVPDGVPGAEPAGSQPVTGKGEALEPTVEAPPRAPASSHDTTTSPEVAEASTAKPAEATKPLSAKALVQRQIAESQIPDYVRGPTVLHLIQLALRRAEKCHPGGHAVGTAQVFITFDPNGRSSATRLEGEPVASAPVAECILVHARSVRIPAFEGEAFTARHAITMR